MKKVAIVAGSRTPFVKAAGAFSNLTALDLATQTVENLVVQNKINPTM